MKQRQVSAEIKNKIRHFYNNLRLEFLDFQRQYDLLEELPESLQGELSLVLNKQLVQRVRFFQLAEPEFIMGVSRLMRPQISVVGEYVVQIDEVATKMYFIDSGVVTVLATDNQTVLAYQGPGCYFGEIGVFLTGKRSCSVKIKESATLFKIHKDDLLKMIEPFPMQAKLFRAIARQRLQTTAPEDLVDGDPCMIKQFEREKLGRNDDESAPASLEKQLDPSNPEFQDK